MAQRSEDNPDLDGGNWQELSIAFLLGLIAFSFMAAVVVIHQPAIGATINALPLFVVTFVVGVISLPLLWWDSSSGYGLTILTAIMGLVTLGLIGSGTIGNMKPGTPPIAPPVYALIAVILLITTYLALRE